MVCHSKKSYSSNPLSKAFSLIELSIVILVIGILVIGITQGKRIIQEARLKTARSLTNSSPVNSISGLTWWLETTLENSFNSGDRIDGGVGGFGTISTWYDTNTQSSKKNNATQATANNRPIYIANGINNLPVVQFVGSGSINLSFDGSALGLAGGSYTVFIVEQRRASSASSMYIISANPGFLWGYGSATQLQFQHSYLPSGNSYLLGAVGAYTVPISRIISVTYGVSNTQKIAYVNGSVLTQSNGINPLNGFNSSSALGGSYNGYVAEIIVFNKTLKTTERRSVESYLSSKWNIPVS